MRADFLRVAKAPSFNIPKKQKEQKKFLYFSEEIRNDLAVVPACLRRAGETRIQTGFGQAGQELRVRWFCVCGRTYGGDTLQLAA